MNDHHPPQKLRSFAVAGLTILVIALVGPGLGLVLWALGLALAPPWTFLTSGIYPLLACAGLPLGLIALWAKRLRMGGLLATLGLTGMAAILFLAIVGSGVPTGMTHCQPLAAPSSQVRYACISTSSDDASYRYEFILEGWANWPVLRIINSELTPDNATPLPQAQLLIHVWQALKPNTSSHNQANWEVVESRLVLGREVGARFEGGPDPGCVPGPPPPPNQRISPDAPYWYVQMRPRPATPLPGPSLSPTAPPNIPEAIVRQADFLVDPSTSEIVARMLQCVIY